MSDASYKAPDGGRPRVVVTRRAEQASVLGDKLSAAGFRPVYFPTIELQVLYTPDLDQAIADIDRFDWLLFSSANAVHYFFQRLEELDLSPRLPRTAVVGPATARKLETYGVQPDYMPEIFTGVAMAAGLGDLNGKQVLLPRARIGGRQIVESLRDQGAIVRDIALYDTVTAVADEVALEELRLGYEAITFTSPSSVRSFLDLSGGKPIEKAVAACIGPVTAEAAASCGVTVTLAPDDYTLDGLVQILREYFGEKSV